jgi:hypothetical protein
VEVPSSDKRGGGRPKGEIEIAVYKQGANSLPRKQFAGSNLNTGVYIFRDLELPVSTKRGREYYFFFLLFFPFFQSFISVP